MKPARCNNNALALILVLAVCTTPAWLQQQRDQRSIGGGPPRTAQRMMGGYMRINTIKADKKENELTVAAAGEGETQQKNDDDKDEDTKTLSDQIKEGKYALLQNEIFTSIPKRPGVIGYETNPETSVKDNNGTLGGLKKDEIWLSEGHLLVLKGGKYPPPGAKEPDPHWQAIDDYEAPRRQVKLPKKPKVPPPFPVQLKDGGPIVFITSEGGRIPASPMGGLPPPFSPYPSYPFDPYQGDFAPGGAPYPLPPFPFPDFPRNDSEGGPGFFPPPLAFAPTINGSFAGYPPIAPSPPFPQLPPLPDLGNRTEMIDEDDPSLYYPPPYSFSFKTANDTVGPGPIVPGIVLPPPPDFFSLEDDKTVKPAKTAIKKVSSTTTPKPIITSRITTTIRPLISTTKQNVPVKQIVPTLPPQPITVFFKQRQKPIELTRGFIPIAVKTSRPLSESLDNSIEITTTPQPFTVAVEQVPNYRQPDYNAQPEPIVIIPKPIQQKPTDFPLVKTKPAVSIVYDEPDNYYNTNSVQSHNPFLVYGLPKGQIKQQNYANSFVTTTPVPLRAYFGPSVDQRPQQQPQYFKQNSQYFRPAQPNSSPLTSFYFYDEVSKTTTQPPYYSNRQKTIQNLYYDTNSQGYQTINNIDFKPLNSQQGNSLFNFPTRQSSRTLTQEYFSVQRPKGQNNYVSQISTPDSFFKQIAEIQKTIDLYTTPRPNTYYRPNYSIYKQPAKVRNSAKPIYQYSFQSQPQQNSFRAPILDSEPFRPMVTYSEPYEIKYQTTPKTTTFQQYLIETNTATTERQRANKYISVNRGNNYEYNQVPSLNNKQTSIKNNLDNTFRYEVSSPKPPVKSITTSSIKDDLDDITRTYFTLFGQKLDGSSTPSTIVESALENAINVIEDKVEKYPHSLAGDTLVNYRKPLPSINPDSEFIPIADPSLRARLEAERRFNLLRNQVERERQNVAKAAKQSSSALELAEEFEEELSRGALSSDTAVNYRIPLPKINVDSEVVAASGDNAAGEGRPGSFVSYRLPGQGAHVYFLTPRAVAPATQGIR